MKKDDTKLVVAKRFNNYGEAGIFISLLESNGIDAMMWNENMAATLPLGGMPEYIVVVNENDAGKVEKLLAETGK